MGNDEAALLRLWREKRGEVEPEDLSANLDRPCSGSSPVPVNRHSNAISGAATCGLRRLPKTHASPPPFSAMNSMPAVSIPSL